MEQVAQSKGPSLARGLGLLATVSIVVGSVIGSGIFKKPAIMASQLGSPELLLAVWLVAGIITLFGALTNAEVAGIISATGGQYEFFRKMYGDFTGYLYGWAVFAVIQTGSIASITYVFSEYSQYFLDLPRFSPGVEQSIIIPLPFIGTITPLANIGVKAVTIGVISLLTLINYLGVRFGGAIQVAFTGLKIAAILVLVGAAFQYSDGEVGHFVTDAPGAPTGGGMLLALVMAMSGAFWAYDGWNNITYVAGEVRSPQKNIPRGLFLGTLIVVGVYMLVNLAYVYVLPVAGMASSNMVAADVARLCMGPWGAAFVALAVMVSTFGTANGTILASARVYFAMSKRGRFFHPMGSVHPGFRTPGNALVVQAVWASLLVMSGTFDTLTDMLIFVSWVFYAIGAYGVFVLRKKLPHVPRPYKVWGYPWVPAIFVVFATVFVVVTLYNDVLAFANGDVPMINSVFGLLLVATGIPLYFLFKRRYPEPLDWHDSANGEG